MPEQLKSVQVDTLQQDGVAKDVMDLAGDSVARRMPILHNEERRLNSDLYIAPDPDVMVAIERETAGRVAYFPAHEPTSSVLGMSSGTPLYYETVFEPLCDELLRKYPDKGIALRGIMTSVNGTLKDAMGYGEDILDIADTVARGVEKTGEVFNVQWMANTLAESTSKDAVYNAMSSLKYIAQYTERVRFALEYEADPTPNTPPDFEDAVFPAVLVYDASGLQKTEHDRFTATFREGTNPRDVLLGAYVLDRP